MDKAMSLMPGAKKINVHACYAVFEEGEFVDRDKLEPKHFKAWGDFAKERGMGLMDNGHYHPTEVVSDKIPALLCFFPEVALHVTRGIRWDSDHVVVVDDETKEIAQEIVRCNALDRVYIALDFFDASINRISAWVLK